MIHPGDMVVIKPNLCTLSHYLTPITHPSVLVPIVDYTVKAGASRILIAEGPIHPTHGLFIFRSRYTNIRFRSFSFLF